MTSLAAVPLLLALGGCLATPDLHASADPLVVTVDGDGGARTNASPERLAAVAEIRAKGETAEIAPYPDVFQTAQTTRLAARQEPLSVAAAKAIEAELAALARQRSAAVTPGEVAVLDARAAALRRLAARGQTELLRR